MIALGLLVTVSVLPTLLNAALPETTAGPVGLARPSAAKHDATSAHNSFTRGTPRNGEETINPPLDCDHGAANSPICAKSQESQTLTGLSIVRRSRFGCGHYRKFLCSAVT